MSESLRDAIEKAICEEENIGTAYSEVISLNERIDEEITCDELRIVLENLEEL